MLHIKLKHKKCRTLCKLTVLLYAHPGPLDWVKRSDIEKQISIFIMIEIIDLIGDFGYGLMNT